MKTTMTKKFFTCLFKGAAFMLILGGMISSTGANAQGCTCVPSQPAGWCYVNSHGQTKCMRINHFPDGWRMGNENIESAPLTISPNPVSNSATISFFNEEAQQISIRIFDMNGRLVTTLADHAFEEGGHQVDWNANDVNSGIYFLQFQSEENSQMLKLVVTK